MLKFPSPLSGFSTPFGTHGALSAYAVGSFEPDLVFDFANEYYRTGGTETTFDSAMTHSRSGNATMVDSDGLLKWAPHNLLTSSEDVDASFATKQGVSVASGNNPAPDGSNTADRVEQDASTGFHRLAKTGFSANHANTFSAWLKAGEVTTVALAIFDGSTFTARVIFDLSSGVINTTQNGSGAITDAGNGWYLCEVFSSSGSASSTLYVYSGTTVTFQGVTGDGFYIWGAHLYRSDLGGMVNNPDRGDSYVPTTSAARYLARRGHHVYNGSAWVNEGVLVESEARTNLLLNSGTLATQNVTVTAQAYTLHFTGTGTVTLSGASTAGPLVGTGTGENNRVNLTFTPTAGTLALTVSGTVTNAQLEAGSTPSSYIPTSGATVTRAAETLTVPAANLPWSSDAVSLQMQGQMTYVDDGDNATATFVRWQAISGQYIQKRLRTDSTRTGASYALMNNGVATIGQDTNGAVADLSAGINVPFNTASRFGSTFLNVALDGVAASALSTPTALPDLSSTDLQLGYDYMGTIKLFRIWANDLGDAGIAEAST